MNKIVPRMTLRKRRAKTKVVRDSVSDYTSPQRNEFSLAAEFDQFFSALYPVRKGKQVVLHLRVKPPPVKRVVVKPKTHRVVILTPMLEHHGVLVSVLGSGACMVTLQGKNQVADLILAGIPLVPAGLLAKTLKQVLQEK